MPLGLEPRKAKTPRSSTTGSLLCYFSINPVTAAALQVLGTAPGTCSSG